ncbi:MAG TPA: competence/damage-inducible protein A [Lentimicrobium sp.]|nr:competence/damage-inducible protein A [Lentimicrobium sp.]
MKTEIITIGDELLIGQVIDTNSAWMATELNAIGIKVVQITSIGDDHDQIISALKDATGRADIIITTGGLGPTRDDITKLAICDFFKTHLVFDEDSYHNIERIFNLRGYKMTESNRRQAEVPASCSPLLNENGTAPGMLFRQNGRIYFSLPGVPFEMKALMTRQVIPLLKPLSNKTILHKTILTQGVGESFLADKIKDWESSLPPNFKLAYLPQPGMVRLRVTATGTSAEELKKSLGEYITLLYSLIPEYIFGEDNESLESILGQLLKNHNLTLSTAESCTGGSIAQMITSIPGSSAYFKGSIVSYSNEVKVNTLNVKDSTIANYGAVSRETVIEMAEGVKKQLNTDCSIAVSGIAGPDGGTPDKPVGTVWVAVITPYSGVVTKKFLFGENRERNIRRSSLAALDMLRQALKGI